MSSHSNDIITIGVYVAKNSKPNWKIFICGVKGHVLDIYVNLLKLPMMEITNVYRCSRCNGFDTTPKTEITKYE